MSNYNQNGAYSDTNYSQAQGYSYPAASSNAPYGNQVNNNFQSHGTQYSNQQYGTTSQSQTNQPFAQQQSNTSTSLAAAALSSLSSHDYSQNSAGNNKDIASGQTTNSDWSQPTYGQTAYSSSSNRAQTDHASKYGTNNAPVSTFGRLSLPEQRSASSRPATTQSYQATPANTAIQHSSQHLPVSSTSTSGTYTTQGSTQQHNLQRYASPLHAVQAQQHYQGINRPPSRMATNSSSPQMTAPNVHQTQKQWMPSESTNSTQATVDSSQVFDFRAEQQRKAKIEAERREKRAAEEAIRKAEQDRLDAERRAEEERQNAESQQAEAERQRIESEGQRLAAEKQRADEDARKAKEAADKKAKAAKQARKARAQEKKAKTSAAQAANMAAVEPAAQPAAMDEEAQMRAMFQKMREFNSRNPEMLAKLWDEERQAHVASVTNNVSTSNGSAAEPVPGTNPAAASSIPRSAGNAHSPNRPAQPNTSAARKVPGQSKPSSRVPAQATMTSMHTSAPQSSTPQAPVSTVLGRAYTGSPSLQPAAVQTSALSTSIPASTGSSAPTTAAPASVEQPVSTLWPSHKKGSLSKIAAKWLSELPQNVRAGKTISKHEVLAMVETDPSYVQFCELVEAKGIKFERSVFARQLLKTIPQAPPPIREKLKSSGPKKAAAASRVHPQQTPGSGNGSLHSAVGSLTDTPAFSTTSQHPAAIAHPLPVTAPQQQPPTSAGIKSAETPTMSPAVNSPRPPPANKEEAARKRTFGDLVDLANDDSDDDAPPRKIIQMSAISSGPKDEHFSKPISYSAFINAAKQGQPAYGPPGNPVLAQAIHNTGYNTFARQGQAPPQTMPMLPVQQIGTPTVPAPASASTPVPKKPTARQLELERQQIHRMKGQMLVEPIMRDRVARKSKYDSRSIARDVLLATGRHPNMKPLNFHLSIMQKLLGDHGGMMRGGESSDRGNRSDLSTIRWNIIDPGTPSEQALQKAPKPPSSYTEDMERSPDLEERRDRSVDRRAQQHGRELESPASSAKPIPARRGRPPKNHAFAKASPVATPKSQSSGQKPPSGMPTASPIGYASFAQTTVDENGNVVKRKGRPVGWRKSIHSREAHGLTPASHSKPTTNTANRLRQQSQPKSDRDSLQEPHYQVYACGWDGCRAELHNLDTLKKHVIKLHGKPSADNGFECDWAYCNLAGTSTDHRGRQQKRDDQDPARFATIEQWVQHIDKAHLQPVAWKLGDGPGMSEEG
jgi:hypothetical protein